MPEGTLAHTIELPCLSSLCQVQKHKKGTKITYRTLIHDDS